MAAAISEAEAAEDTESQDTVNTEEAIELPIENMTADDIISAIGGIPETAEKAEKENMQKHRLCANRSLAAQR